MTGKKLEKKSVKRVFRSAREELKHAEHHEISSAYRLAFADQDFLVRRELRAVRLQLELLKPELILHDAKIKSTVVVFGSARLTEKSAYYKEAREFAKLVAVHGKDESGNDLVIITGGGPGIMEAANRGADDVGAKNIGLNIVLPMEQGPNPYITPEFCFQFHYFAIRKMHFLIRAKALVIFPGGYGTLDELFETLTLIQTRKIKPIPVILVGQSYWVKVINFDMLIQEGMIDKDDINLINFVDTADQAWQIIKKAYGSKE